MPTFTSENFIKHYSKGADDKQKENLTKAIEQFNDALFAADITTNDKKLAEVLESIFVTGKKQSKEREQDPNRYTTSITKVLNNSTSNLTSETVSSLYKKAIFSFDQRLLLTSHCRKCLRDSKAQFKKTLDVTKDPNLQKRLEDLHGKDFESFVSMVIAQKGKSLTVPPEKIVTVIERSVRNLTEPTLMAIIQKKILPASAAFQARFKQIKQLNQLGNEISRLKKRDNARRVLDELKIIDLIDLLSVYCATEQPENFTILIQTAQLICKKLLEDAVCDLILAGKSFRNTIRLHQESQGINKKDRHLNLTSSHPAASSSHHHNQHAPASFLGRFFHANNTVSKPPKPRDEGSVYPTP